MSNKYILEMNKITKTFPGVKALNEVEIKVRCNEIHFVVGENGAGKSTLMKVLSGIYPFGTYSGDICYNGKISQYKGITDSVNDGIVIINQELALFPDLTVYENIFVGHEIKNQLGIINWEKTKELAKKYIDIVGLDVNIYDRVGTLGVGKQQLIEIAKALSQNVKLLILDEPTAALNEDDSENLLKLIVELKNKGITCIMISHKLKEVEAIADSITVIRDGVTISRMDKDEINEVDIIKNMVGREIEDIYPKRDIIISKEVILETVNFSSYDKEKNKLIVNDINIKLHKGEIIGIAGLMGAGRTELAHSIFGNSKGYKVSGSIIFDSKVEKIGSPKRAIDLGMAYVSEDRKYDGLILSESIAQNITITNLEKLSRFGVLDYNKQLEYSIKYSNDMTVKAPSVNQLVGNLSGGNQQKVQIAKWLFANPKVLILDEPTRGIDVGAKFEIYTIMNNLVAAGMSIIMISSELPELLGMTDRIYVLAEGVQTAEFITKDVTSEQIMEKATV